MFRNKPFYKVMDNLSKEKCMNKETITPITIISKNDTRWILKPSSINKAEMRSNIVETLKDIDFKRGDKKWTQYTVVAFISEVLENYMFKLNKEKEISERYNVPTNKLDARASMFLSLHRIRYCLDNFFTDYNFIIWKFRDMKIFNKLLKQNKITNREIAVLLELGLISQNKKSGEFIIKNSIFDIIER